MEATWNPALTRVHSLAIELTAFCNQRCDYCYNAWREDGGASLGTPALRTPPSRGSIVSSTRSPSST